MFFLVFLIFSNIGFAMDAQNLIAVLKSDTEHKKKWQARADLVKIGKGAVELLIVLVSERHNEGSYYAIRALGEIRDERAVEILSEVLLDKTYGPRRYAALALGKIGSARAVPVLVEALRDVSYVREDALRALKWIGTPEAKEATREFWLEQDLEPNGLKAGLALKGHRPNSIGPGDVLELQVLFENSSDKAFSLYLSGIYKASLLIIESDGMALQWEQIVEYRYEESERDYPVLSPGEQLLWEISGKVKRDAIEFKDLKFQVSARAGDSLRIFVVYELKEDGQGRAQALGGRDNLWQGKVVSEPITLIWR